MEAQARLTDQLTVAEAARELELKDRGSRTAELVMMRMIARRRIRASRIGPGGPWRIAAAEISRFIQAGAPDIAPPPIESGWFAPPEAGTLARSFVAAIIDAAADQVPEKLPAERTVAVSTSPALRAVLDAQPPAPRARIRGRDSAPQFATWVQAYLVDGLRKIAQNVVGHVGGGLRALYASPEAYEAATAAAVRKLRAGRIAFTRLYPGVAGDPAQSSAVRVQFLLPHSRLMTPAVEAAAVERAF